MKEQEKIRKKRGIAIIIIGTWKRKDEKICNRKKDTYLKQEVRGETLKKRNKKERGENK